MMEFMQLDGVRTQHTCCLLLATLSNIICCKSRSHFPLTVCTLATNLANPIVGD
uniref:Uncharacterized protein n=1 Tax=Arundo donax TaxID=35708 RepID=A0A0A9ACW8_ARUDO